MTSRLRQQSDSDEPGQGTGQDAGQFQERQERPERRERRERRIRVLIIDDSALVRHILTDICRSDPELEVVGTAIDPIMARDKIKQLAPDVLTLDVEMPRMNGVEFLEKLMRLRPMPVVMISSYTRDGADITLRALELGAVDYVAKPEEALETALPGLRDEILTKIKAAAFASVRNAVGISRAIGAHPAPPAGLVAPAACLARLIAIGASTGGVEAITALLKTFPPTIPGVVMVQHMPAAFTPRFAARLDEGLPFRVQEARDGQPVTPGQILLAPGDRHLRVVREVEREKGSGLVARLSDDPPVSGHRPSVDVLFQSIAELALPAVGVLLTGMGRDGAEGLLRLRRTGALTIAQDAASSAVFGMPKAAIALEAARQVLPLSKIAPAIFTRSSPPPEDQE